MISSRQVRVSVTSIVRAAAALCFATQPVWAQQAASPTQDPVATAESESIQELVVTGSRVARDGYSAPTPVNVISADEIQADAPANITDFVNTLPSIRGSSTPATTSGSVSPGGAGISSLNLRSLGTGRTLVLFDGQRSVVSAATGQVDINTFPQSLIERVEVVTGGASSAYGSDAVGGVVNFILDRKFTGLKSEVEYGQTTYGDAGNTKVNLTGGMPFAADRGHILFSAEYFTADIVTDKIRDWNSYNYFTIQNTPAAIAAGQPFYIMDYNIGIAGYTPGGLVTGCAPTAACTASNLRGTYFGSGGSVNRFTYGDITTGQWTRGGDGAVGIAGMLGTNTLSPGEERKSGFGRASFKLTDSVELFGQASYARYNGQSYYIQPTQTGITIQRDNAYLPASVRATMVANNVTSLTLGTSNADMPASGSDNVRATTRFVVGANGDFEMFAKGFKWDTYYQRGETRTDEQLTDVWYTPNLALATDAVFNSAGQIVCRSTLTNPSNGCVPLNRFGIGVASAAALDYVLDTPLRNQQFTQDVAAINLSTSDFEGWAGPISFATGVEYRKENMTGQVDPRFNTGWKYGNYLVTNGNYNVTEGYVETVVPILEGLEFNGAGRLTDYSTSGSVQTWKLGFTYSPIDDIKFRASKSHDIRAPNMSELYATGTARSNSVPINGLSVPFVQKLQGNLDLVPEEADAIGVGIVLTPRFLPGFAMSVDYYDVDVDSVIDSLTAEQTVNFCYLNNVQRYCDNINFVNGVLDTIDLYYENLNNKKSTGIDFESSYSFGLAGGAMNLRAMATHYIHNVTDNNVTAIDLAGSNANDTPDWVYRVSALYKRNTWMYNLTARGLSSGVVSNAYTECTSACPPSASPFFSVNDNSLAGAIYFDASATYGFDLKDMKSEVFVAVKNLLDRDPALVANPASIAGENTPAYLQTNRSLYDVLGRTVRLGVRVSF